MSDTPVKLAPRFNPKIYAAQVINCPGVAFDQNNVLYNEAYQAVDIDGNLLPMVAAPQPKQQAAPQPQAPAPAADDDDTLEDEKPLDLEGWIAGGTPYHWGVMTAYLQRVTGEKPANKAAAIELAKRVLAGEFPAGNQ